MSEWSKREREMDDPMGFGEPEGRTRRSGTRAAVGLWLLAGINLVLFGCCAVVLGVTSALPEDQMREAMAEENLTAEEIDQVVTVQPMMLWLAVGVGVLLVIPSVVLAFLGAGVRRGRWGPAVGALVIVCVQGVVVGVLLLLNVLGAAGQWVAGLTGVLLFGGLLAVMVWTVSELIQVLRASGEEDGGDGQRFEDEPWNQI